MGQVALPQAASWEGLPALLARLVEALHLGDRQYFLQAAVSTSECAAQKTTPYERNAGCRLLHSPVLHFLYAQQSIND